MSHRAVTKVKFRDLPLLQAVAAEQGWTVYTIPAGIQLSQSGWYGTILVQGDEAVYDSDNGRQMEKFYALKRAYAEREIAKIVPALRGRVTTEVQGNRRRIRIQVGGRGRR